MESKDSLLKSIEDNILSLKAKHNVSFSEVINLLKSRKKETLSVPVSVFNNDRLSVLESVVKFLKENKRLSYKDIAGILNRNYAPIAITYRNSRKKLSSSLNLSSQEKIPVNIFSNKALSVLENITCYMKEKMNLSFHEIALFLKRDDRTIWTVYSRAKNKRKERAK